MRLASRILVLCTVLSACGLRTIHPAGGPSHRYQMSGFSVVAPEGHGWWVTGGRAVTNDALFVPQDRDVYPPSRANFLMFSQIWSFSNDHSRIGAFAVREGFTMPAGGLEGLQALLAARLAREIPRSRFARYEVALAVTDTLGRACVQLTLDLGFQPWSATDKHPYVHRGVRYWCPASAAEGSPIVRLGFFEYHRDDDPPRRDFMPDILPMVRSLEFTGSGTQGSR